MSIETRPALSESPASNAGSRARPAEIRVARMEPLARLPLFFDLNGRRVTLAGDKDAAAWKAELLSAAGAIVESSPQIPRRRSSRSHRSRPAAQFT